MMMRIIDLGNKSEILNLLCQLLYIDLLLLDGLGGFITCSCPG